MKLVILILGILIPVVIYFANNPMKHKLNFTIRRFMNWFPLGMTYAFLYMGRYNLTVAKTALGNAMSKEDFGLIFAAGTLTYACSFLVNGPLVDRIGGKRGIIIGALGSSVANFAMGVLTYYYVTQGISMNLALAFSILYSLNMYFQSYGAVSIMKVNSHWFHVRERGVFGGVFGTLISLGMFFAFDIGSMIILATKANLPSVQDLDFGSSFLRTIFLSSTGQDATWAVFFVPAAIIFTLGIIDIFALRDNPSQAGYENFDTDDASSGEMDKEFTTGDLLKRIFTSPIMITIAFIEFSAGVLRNGITQWYFIFVKELNITQAAFFHENWGLLLCFAGIFGGFISGFISDKLFQSRRGPSSALLMGSMFILTIIMSIYLFSHPLLIGVVVILLSMTVIGIHGILSGTAAMDFGGRKGAATAVGIIDGFVYLGTAIQSAALGYITSWNWQYWPIFLIPFTLIGLILSMKIWQALPEAARRKLELEKSSHANS